MNSITSFDKNVIDALIKCKNNIIFQNEIEKILMLLVKNYSYEFVLAFVKKYEHIDNIFNLLAKYSAKVGSLELLKYVFDKNAEVYKQTAIDKDFAPLETIQKERLNMLRECYKISFLNGHFQCTEFLINKLNHYSYRIVNAGRYFASNGYIEFLKIFHETQDLDFTWDEKICQSAAIYGQLECLTYLINNGYSIAPKIYLLCAEYNKVECMNVIYKKKYKLHAHTSIVSAKYGSIDTLIFAHNHGCPIDLTVCAFATYTGNYECLVYACNNILNFDKIKNNWNLFIKDHNAYLNINKNKKELKYFNIDGRNKCINFLKNKLNISN
jgi:hypothetical protein